MTELGHHVVRVPFSLGRGLAAQHTEGPGTIDPLQSLGTANIGCPPEPHPRAQPITQA